MSETDVSIQDFWIWFTDHLSEFDGLSKSNQPFWDVALEQIKKIDTRLWFELSNVNNGIREFVVTAQGHTAAFPIVERLVALAPKTKYWDFVALKPPMGFSFKTNYEQTHFDPDKMWFLPLDSSSRPQDLGLRVGIQGLASIDRVVAHNALLVILDAALGERSAALYIQHTEVCELPSDPESHGYIELRELPDYIAWRQKKLSSQ